MRADRGPVPTAGYEIRRDALAEVRVAMFCDGSGEAGLVALKLGKTGAGNTPKDCCV
ncbi:MAG: hypothetical protein WAT09_10330 [Paracoccaceae bacterium]